MALFSRLLTVDSGVLTDIGNKKACKPLFIINNQLTGAVV